MGSSGLECFNCVVENICIFLTALFFARLRLWLNLNSLLKCLGISNPLSKSFDLRRGVGEDTLRMTDPTEIGVLHRSSRETLYVPPPSCTCTVTP